MREPTIIGNSSLAARLFPESACVATPRRLADEVPVKFVATPNVIAEGASLSEWLRSTVLEYSIDPVAADGDARLGLCILDAASRGGARYTVVAGESHLLEHLWVAGTLAGVDPSLEHLVDWEIVLYRFATKVITPSSIAADLLRRHGIRSDVEVARLGDGAERRERWGDANVVWLPEPQSRRAQTGTMLRALSTLDSVPRVVLNKAAEPDPYWAGSTAEANSAVLDLLGDEVWSARRAPRSPGFVLLGDPFRVPTAQAGRLRQKGATVVVPRGSTAASMWPDAPTWETEADIVAIVADEEVARPTAVRGSLASTQVAERRLPELDRARKVSVGVPVFGDVRFLDECIESILSQTETPHEVVIIDDGSGSKAVDDALAAWERRASGVVKTLRQPNRGVCVARNTMLDTMTGDAFILVDSDDVLLPTFIERTAEALRADTRLSAVSTWTEFFGDYEGVEAKPPFDARVGMRENPIVSTAVLVDMSVRDEGIRFAPDLAFIYCEDWDFWSQIVAAGGRFGLVPEPLVRHRVHPTSGGHRRTEAALRVGKARATARLACAPSVW